jgi:lysozyme family protein
MTRFDECLQIILRFEGGFVNDPVDNGGATNKGITQRTYDAFRHDSGLSGRPVKLISGDEISSIYKTRYWFVAKCPLLCSPLDLYTFDAAVQHGPARAVKQLQSALGVTADGQWGPKSIDALNEEINAGQVKELAAHLIATRLDFYEHIIENNPSQERFRNGWMNRIEQLRRLA